MANRKLLYVIEFTWDDVRERMKRITRILHHSMAKRDICVFPVKPHGIKIMPIFLEMVTQAGWVVTQAKNEEEANLFLDAAINTGRTQNAFVTKYRKPFYALVTKRDQGWEKYKDAWIVFPWEDPDKVVPSEVGIEQ